MDAQGELHAIVLQGDQCQEKAKDKIAQTDQKRIDSHLRVCDMRHEKQYSIQKGQEPFILQPQTHPL